MTPSACDIDISSWLTNLTNEGTEDVGGTETIHVARRRRHRPDHHRRRRAGHLDPGCRHAGVRPGAARRDLRCGHRGLDRRLLGCRGQGAAQARDQPGSRSVGAGAGGRQRPDLEHPGRVRVRDRRPQRDADDRGPRGREADQRAVRRRRHRSGRPRRPLGPERRVRRRVPAVHAAGDHARRDQRLRRRAPGLARPASARGGRRGPGERVGAASRFVTRLQLSMTAEGNAGGGARRFLFSAQGWPYLLTPFIPAAVALELAHADAVIVFFVAAARDRPDGGTDGARHGGAGGQVRSGHRRAAQRHLRQRTGADHRPDRPERGTPGGGQGLDRRLDHRQHPARARRLDAGRGPQAPAAALQRAGGQHPGDDAVPGRRCAGDAGDLRAGRGPGPPEPDRRGDRLRLDGREPLAGGRDRPHRHLRRRPLVLAADPQGPLQPALRRGARGGLRLERAPLGDHAVRRRAGGRADVGGAGRLDQRGVRVDRAVASSSSG